MKKITPIILIMVVVFLGLAACAPEATPEPTQPPSPSSTPTNTPEPTFTPTARNTPLPLPTIAPTNTPLPDISGKGVILIADTNAPDMDTMLQSCEAMSRRLLAHSLYITVPTVDCRERGMIITIANEDLKKTGDFFFTGKGEFVLWITPGNINKDNPLPETAIRQLSNEHTASVDAHWIPGVSQRELQINFNAEGVQKMREVTNQHKGKFFVVTLDDQAIFAGPLNFDMAGYSIIIRGLYTIKGDDWETLEAMINGGPMSYDFTREQ